MSPTDDSLSDHFSIRCASMRNPKSISDLTIGLRYTRMTTLFVCSVYHQVS